MNFLKKNGLLVSGFFLLLFFSVFFVKNVMASETGQVSAQNNSDAVIPSYPTDSEGNTFKFSDAKIGDIISALLPSVFTIAGLILLVILIFGGMGLMTAAGDPKKIEAAKGRITMAFVGFLIVFASYFIAQIVQVMLGVNFLGGSTTSESTTTESAAQEVQIKILDSNGNVVSQETQEIDDDYDPGEGLN